jgi:hypothetical protein
MGLLRAGDPRQEVWFAWNANEVVRQIYDHTDPDLAVEWVDEIGRDLTDREMPVEVRRLGRTITRWTPQICAWHRSHVSNRPTEAVNNLAKRIKRVAFGLTNFRHHRALPPLRRPPRLDPAPNDPTLKRGEPVMGHLGATLGTSPRAPPAPPLPASAVCRRRRGPSLDRRSEGDRCAWRLEGQLWVR